MDDVNKVDVLFIGAAAPHDLRVSCTAVRVPVLVGHSEAVHVETRDPIGPDQARALFAATPGVDVIFIGTSDLSFSLGLRGRQDDPKLEKAVTEMLETGHVTRARPEGHPIEHVPRRRLVHRRRGRGIGAVATLGIRFRRIVSLPKEVAIARVKATHGAFARFGIAAGDVGHQGRTSLKT
jgi:hypothetical protein